MSPASIELSATEAIAAMRDGDLRAEDYAAALLDRAREVEHLNVFRSLNVESVLEAARKADRMRRSGRPLGALHGLPIPVKDSVNTHSLPTSQGTAALRRFQPKRDAAIIERLAAQGAIVMGKTNLHELSRGYTSNNFAFGPVLNPNNIAHVPGGSSGGSGAAVAARISPLALAEDTLGSIRVPASMCGIAGLRPTHGRYPNDGIMSLTIDKFDQCGPLSRSVEDLALFDRAVTGEASLAPAELSAVRIGFAPEFFLESVDADVERITREVVASLRGAGAVIVETALPDECKDALGVAGTIIACENIESMSAYLREYDTGLTFDEMLRQASPLMQRYYEITTPPSRDVYEEALRRRGRIRGAICKLFAELRLAALLFPPILSLPPPLGDNLEIDVRGTAMPIRTVMGRNTALGSVAGLCSVVLKGGVARANLPVGIEFAGPPGTDRQLLAACASVGAALAG
jgi:Asp-tRNA(Asn)/Glu-tRNA(Gln) amidotransferase A subunit family amidase